MDRRAPISASLLDNGFAFVHADELRGALEAVGPLSDWPEFSSSWNDLEVDAYLADQARFRRRRYAVFDALPGGTFERQAHQPHYQHVEYNMLFGGVERWFEPVNAAIGAGPTLTTVLAFCHAVFGGLTPSIDRWHVEVHQFRIEARAAEQGYPTPEGVHRDGVDFVFVMLVNRCNIASGTTTVHDPDGRQLGAFTLAHPCDAALVDDRRVAHGVTPVRPIDPALPAYRDVLVVTFRRADGSSN